MFYYFVVGVTLALIQTNGCFNFFLVQYLVKCRGDRLKIIKKMSKTNTLQTKSMNLLHLNFDTDAFNF